MSTIESEKNDMTKKTGSIILFFLLITALLLPKQAVYAGTISISSTKETIYEGESIQLDIDGSETDVTWSSANDKIAIVDSDGIVTGIKKGTVKITATSDYNKVSCIITVKKASISEKEVEITVGSTHTIKLVGSQIVSCSSQNKKVAKVSKKGIITAVGAGETIIKVKGANGKTYKCIVTVPNPDKPELPSEYKKLVKLVKKNGLLVEGKYLYEVDVPYSWYGGYTYYVEYNPDTDIIEMYYTNENDTEIALISIDPYDLTTAEIECYIYYNTKQQDIYANGYIDIKTYSEYEDITLNIEGKVTGYSKKNIKSDVSSAINRLLQNITEGLSYKNVKISKLGFKQYKDYEFND